MPREAKIANAEKTKLEKTSRARTARDLQRHRQRGKHQHHQRAENNHLPHPAGPCDDGVEVVEADVVKDAQRQSDVGRHLGQVGLEGQVLPAEEVNVERDADDGDTEGIANADDAGDDALRKLQRLTRRGARSTPAKSAESGASMGVIWACGGSR